MNLLVDSLPSLELAALKAAADDVGWGHLVVYLVVAFAAIRYAVKALCAAASAAASAGRWAGGKLSPKPSPLARDILEALDSPFVTSAADEVKAAAFKVVLPAASPKKGTPAREADMQTHNGKSAWKHLSKRDRDAVLARARSVASEHRAAESADELENLRLAVSGRTLPAGRVAYASNLPQAEPPAKR